MAFFVLMFAVAGWPGAQQIFVAVDAGVLPFADTLLESLQSSTGLPVHVRAVPSGESSKSVPGLHALWDWLLESGIQRGDVVVFAPVIVAEDDIVADAHGTIIR